MRSTGPIQWQPPEYRRHATDTLYLISFPLQHHGDIELESYWDAHPDGIGYLHKWTPKRGYSVIVLSEDDNAVRRKIGQWQTEEWQKKAELDTKLRLGEIDSDYKEAELSAVRSRLQKAAVTWATGL